MLIGLIRYKLAKQKVIKSYKDYVGFNYSYFNTIFYHYFDYFQYLKDSVNHKFKRYIECGCAEHFLTDCEFYTNEILKNKEEFENIIKNNSFKIKIVKSMYNKGLFDDDLELKTRIPLFIDHFESAVEIYKNNFQSISPHLMIKEYLVTEKLKRLQGDF